MPSARGGSASIGKSYTANCFQKIKKPERKILCFSERQTLALLVRFAITDGHHQIERERKRMKKGETRTSGVWLQR